MRDNPRLWGLDEGNSVPLGPDEACPAPRGTVKANPAPRSAEIPSSSLRDTNKLCVISPLVCDVIFIINSKIKLYLLIHIPTMPNAPKKLLSTESGSGDPTALQAAGGDNTPGRSPIRTVRFRSNVGVASNSPRFSCCTCDSSEAGNLDVCNLLLANFRRIIF